ncbi:MAG: CAP domain-containing protein, partial [Acidobacteria bacterium]|nr:CAP domain-containing protein [Acidobacteriota bacterium]
GPVKGFHFEGNINFNNGAPARPRYGYDRIDNLLIGSTIPVERITVQNNYLYHPLTTSGFSLRLGYRADANEDAVLKDNYIAGGTQPLCTITRWKRLTVTGNTMIADTHAVMLFTPRGQTPNGYTWDNNRYFTRNSNYPFSYAEYSNDAGYSFTNWKTSTGLDQQSQWLDNRNGRPTGTQVFVRPNQYETGRAHLAVFNWDLQPAITLNAAQLTGVLRAGDRFIIQNAQALKGEPVASGVYDGVSIQLPLRGGTLGLEFNAFLLLKTGRQALPSTRADALSQRTITDVFTTTSELDLNDDEGFTLDEEELRILQQLNEWRLAQHLSPLSVNTNLCQASEWSAQDMAQHEQADTTDSLGRNATQRARAFGFPGTLASVDESEWVYASDASESAALENLFNQGLPTMSAWKSIGLARVYNANTGRWYWSVLFGAY